MTSVNEWMNMSQELSNWLWALQIYTNGLYTPTVHRVVNADPTISRVSIPFFYECAFETEVAPILQLFEGRHSPNEQPLQPIKYGSHLLNKVLNNFDFKERRKLITASWWQIKSLSDYGVVCVAITYSLSMAMHQASPVPLKSILPGHNHKRPLRIVHSPFASPFLSVIF